MLEQVACGEVGLNIDYFYSLTPREFSNILTGYRKKEDEAFKDRWQQTRMLMHTMVLPNLKKGQKLSPQQLLEFPWETKENKTQSKHQKKNNEDFWNRVTELHYKDN